MIGLRVSQNVTYPVPADLNEVFSAVTRTVIHFHLSRTFTIWSRLKYAGPFVLGGLTIAAHIGVIMCGLETRANESQTEGIQCPAYWLTPWGRIDWTQ